MIIFLETSEKKQVFSAAKYTVGRRDEVQSFFAHRYSQRCARDPAIRGTCKTFQIKKRGDTTQSTRENTKKNNCFFFNAFFFWSESIRLVRWGLKTREASPRTSSPMVGDGGAEPLENQRLPISITDAALLVRPPKNVEKNERKEIGFYGGYLYRYGPLLLFPAKNATHK